MKHVCNSAILFLRTSLKKHVENFKANTATNAQSGTGQNKNSYLQLH